MLLFGNVEGRFKVACYGCCRGALLKFIVGKGLEKVRWRTWGYRALVCGLQPAVKAVHMKVRSDAGGPNGQDV